MITALQAREIAEKYLKAAFESRYGDNIVILDDQTIEKSRGWVFAHPPLHGSP